MSNTTTTPATPADDLKAAVDDLEAKSAAFDAAKVKSDASTAQAQADAAAAMQAHSDLKAAIAKVVSDADALDPDTAAPAAKQ